MEVALTTTQSYSVSPNPDGTLVNMTTGRISVLDITLKNAATDDHERWPGSMTGGTLAFKAGIRYTFTNVHADDIDLDLSDVGGPNFADSRLVNGTSTRYEDLVEGYSFVAEKTASVTANAATAVSFSSISNAVGMVTKVLQGRASIIGFGKILKVSGTDFTTKIKRNDKADQDLVTGSGNSAANKFAVILENSGYQNPAVADIPMAAPTGIDSSLVHANYLLVMLNRSIGKADNSTDVFDVVVNDAFDV